MTQPLRIVYDGQIYSSQSAGGINRYFGSVVGRLPITCEPTLLVAQTGNTGYPSHPNLRLVCAPTVGPRLLSDRIFAPAWLRSRTRNERFDVAHPTYYNLATRQPPGKSGTPLVITVWDMIDEIYPHIADRRGKQAQSKRRAVMAADALICISNNTRDDLLATYPVDEDRVSVVPLASELHAEMADPNARVPAEPYLLYVGSRAPYKNFDRLLTAFGQIARIHLDLRLCVVGAGLTSAERADIARLGISDRIIEVRHPTDGHLARLYQCSRAFVYPSTYEGFGIPPLEAMACGTPVVCSNASSLPEVVGDAAIMFDPSSTDELTHALLQAVELSADARESMIDRGMAQAATFSWNDHVHTLVNVYRTLTK